MSTPTRCRTCDRPKATSAQRSAFMHSTEFSALSFPCCLGRPWECHALAVDWRARCLKAELERDALLAMPSGVGRFIRSAAEANARASKAESALALMSTPLSPEALQAIAEESES